MPCILKTERRRISTKYSNEADDKLFEFMMNVPRLTRIFYWLDIPRCLFNDANDDCLFC